MKADASGYEKQTNWRLQIVSLVQSVLKALKTKSFDQLFALTQT